MATEKSHRVRVGVDVGGTNTDAVVFVPSGREVLSSNKAPTSPDVTTGIVSAVKAALDGAGGVESLDVSLVSIGTTAFLNAVVQRRGLSQVAVIRLAAPATTGVPPGADWPADLRSVVLSAVPPVILRGGHEFDGRTISDLDEEGVKVATKAALTAGVRQFAVSAVFSPVRPVHEDRTRVLILETAAKAGVKVGVTVSHEVGGVGMLERENAAVLNACLRPMASSTIAGFVSSCAELGLAKTTPLMLTQNDGTLVSATRAVAFPVQTFASGPTNSIRGAAFLAGVDDAIVVDIGGTTTDVGVLERGLARQSGTEVIVGDVHTLFRMPAVHSVGLGGGSIVRTAVTGEGSGCPVVGPDSVGYKLTEDARVFGGTQLTASDIAVAAGHAKGLGDAAAVADLDTTFVASCMAQMQATVEAAIDAVKTSSDDVPVILCGGGAVLMPPDIKLHGASRLLVPPHAGVANAVGAAVASVSGDVSRIVPYAEGESDEDRKAAAVADATAAAVAAGASPATIKTVNVEHVPLAYVPGGAATVVAKCIGDLDPSFVFDVHTGDDDVATVDAGGSGSGSGSGGGGSGDGGASDSAEDGAGRAAAVMATPTPTAGPSTSSSGLVQKDADGAWIVSARDLDYIAEGAAVLGAGGGGAPFLALLHAKAQLAKGKVFRIVSPDSLTDSSVTLPVGVMGAPAVLAEKMFSGREIQSAVQLWAAETGRTPTHLSPAEVGGFNALIGIIAAAELGVACVDLDGMGRAFPKLEMFSFFIYGGTPGVATMASEKAAAAADAAGSATVVKGMPGTAVANDAATAEELEDRFRAAVVGMGCTGGVVLAALEGQEGVKHCVLGSLSLAWHVGRAIHTARANVEDPVAAVLGVQAGKHLFSGSITSLSQETKGGFTVGKVVVSGLRDTPSDGKSVEILFQNEYVLARDTETGSILTCVPDIIAILETETGRPVLTDTVRYGLLVSVIGLACSPIMNSEQALKVVGPHAFGCGDDVVYDPIPGYRVLEPLV